MNGTEKDHVELLEFTLQPRSFKHAKTRKTCTGISTEHTDEQTRVYSPGE